MEALAAGWVLTASVMCVLWVIQLRTRNAGIVDIGWAATLGVLAVLYATMTSGLAARRALLVGLVCLWSLRLSVYLWRRVVGAPEDPRYAALRRRWTGRENSHFFWFFQAQALINVLLSVAFLTVCSDPHPLLGIREALGAAILVLSVLGESVADRQLTAFRADPSNKGRTCRLGLWRYSRHPNYFFEWLHWWAYVFMAAGAPGWGWTLMGPIVMAVFLVKITGIPATEARAAATRSDYRDYQRTTSAFIPWFPK